MRIRVRFGFEKNNNTKSAIENIHENFSDVKSEVIEFNKQIRNN